ncbi:terpene cyclase/mutase family protein [Streptomyces sp. 71268]|uniref:prenyltransferase/squalene oxidase repeat-containing protein n=1 Tax=Streptomyces sp. 71268 TaxID=3002640 RepID=UPI0023F77876|nr:prenyltransferase/squalene oxidase repeat-containing protein [Streptomyces sp. 71268]WEV29161.1 terpene cyclase/mutase family protein [Streptomyces sp. 71268]
MIAGLGPGPLTLATPAAADPIASCTPTKGAVVAVDFSDWGGGIVRGCDATPTTGYDLLHEAGFSTVGTEHDGPAFICRLGHAQFQDGKQYPTPDREACKLTPPASAYWSYWIAPPGQDYWTYSPLGAMSQRPKDGSVEAWVFGATAPGGSTGGPTFTPAQVRAGGGGDGGDTPPDVEPGEVDLPALRDWLTSRLTDGDHVQDEAAQAPHLYQSAQTALAVAGAGGRSETLTKMTSWLAAHTEEFAYPEGTDHAPSVIGAALLALLAASTEGDPRAFGGHDLAGDLAGSLCTAGGEGCAAAGDFVGVDDVETQALAVLALHRSGVPVPKAAVDRLAAHQCKDGGFSATLVRAGETCAYSDPATTPYAVIALHQVGGHADVVARARKTLRTSQLSSGAFAAYPGVTSGDVTASARSAQALRLLGDTRRADAAVSWLSRQQTASGGFGFDEGAADPELFPTWSAALAGARTSLASLTTKRPDLPKPPTTHPTEPSTPPTSGPKPPWRPGEGPDLRKGTAYLVDRSRLQQGHFYENVVGSGFADFGLTIDGAYALAATGYDNGALRGIVDFLDGRGKDTTSSGRTVNDWTGVGTRHAAGGSIGKVAVLAQIVGRDPRDFAGHDLISALAAAVCEAPSQAPERKCAAKGAYAYAPSVFGQSLGVIAQLRAGEKAAASAPVAYLRGLQHASGAWPSLIPSTGDSEVDSTAMAAMALDLVPDAASRQAVEKALAWIASKQLADGGFPGASGNSVNSAALAVQGLSLDASKYQAQIAKARKFLARQQNSDGGFNVAADGQRGSDVRASTQGLGGSVGTSFATLVRDLNGTRPQPPTGTQPTPTPSGDTPPGNGGLPDIVTPGDGGPGIADGSTGSVGGAGTGGTSGGGPGVDTSNGALASTGVQAGGLALAAILLSLAGWRTVVIARRRAATDTGESA